MLRRDNEISDITTSLMDHASRAGVSSLRAVVPPDRRTVRPF
jgi:hypothetical protein